MEIRKFLEFAESIRCCAVWTVNLPLASHQCRSNVVGHQFLILPRKGKDCHAITVTHHSILSDLLVFYFEYAISSA